MDSAVGELARVIAIQKGVTSKLHGLSQDIANSVVVDAQEVVDTASAELRFALPLHQDATEKISSMFFLCSWMTVMLVTFAEAYLEDVLDSFLNASLASSTLPSDLREEFNKKWRKEVMRSGNPSHWINHLRRFGVQGYSDDLPKQLREIWDQRHRIVHSPGQEVDGVKAAQEFIKASKLVTGFVTTTDRFFSSSVSPIPQAKTDPSRLV